MWGAVKERQGRIAEVGYLIVHTDHRRKGIAQELTRRRIEAARAQGLELLFTNVRRNNVESVGNLRKAGFRFWGDFFSAYNTGRVISWYYYPLQDEGNFRANLVGLTKELKPARD